MSYTLSLKTLQDTHHVAKLLGQDIDDHLCKNKQQNQIITFSGQMGVGKTSFISAFIKSFYHLYHLPAPEVTSPTFAIVNEYDILAASTEIKIAHFDLYRLNDPEELYEIGFDAYLDTALCLIEWPEKAQDYLEEPFLKCDFNLCDNIRHLTLTPCTDYTIDKQKFNQFA